MFDKLTMSGCPGTLQSSWHKDRAFRFSSCHCDPALDEGVGNLVAVAMMVPRHVLNLNEIATSLRSSQ